MTQTAKPIPHTPSANLLANSSGAAQLFFMLWPSILLPKSVVSKALSELGSCLRSYRDST